MRKLVISTLALLSITLFSSNQTHASFEQVYIEPVLPSNQTPGIKQYFDLQMKPSTNTIHLQFKVHNPTDKKIELITKGAHAVSSQQGSIIVTDFIDNLNIILLNKDYQMKDYISVDESITLEANETKYVNVDVNTPDLREGTYLGGVIFELNGEPTKQQKQTSKANSITIKVNNKYRKNYAIAMHYPSKDSKSVEINLSEGKIISQYGKPQAEFYLSNPSSSIKKIEDFTISIFKDETELANHTYPLFKISPETKLLLPFPLSNYHAGLGNLTVKVTFKEDGEHEGLTGTLKLAKSQKELQSTTEERTDREILTNDSAYKDWIIYILVFLLFVISGLSFIAGRKSKKKNQEDEQSTGKNART